MINPTKTKNLNINRIKKKNDEILLGKCFGVVWLIKVAKYLKILNILWAIWEFHKRRIECFKKKDEKKTK